jgi:hypothetical protein
MKQGESQRYERMCRRIYEAYVQLREEIEKEDPRPSVLSFPNPDWGIETVGPWRVIYRRLETERGLRVLRETIDTQTARWKDRWSPEHMQKAFRDAIGQIRYENPTEPKAVEQLREVAKALDEPAGDWYAYYPIGGVFFEGELSFGNVRCFRMINAHYERLVETYRNGVGSTLGTDEDRARLTKTWDDEIGALRGQACIEVRVRGGDDVFLQEQADRSLESATDLLQLIVDVTGSWPPTLVVSNVLPHAVPPRVMIRPDGSEAKLHKDFRHMHRATVNAASLQKLRELGFGEILDALEADETTWSETQTKLVNSMHWLAESRRQVNAENQITSAVTAVEMFFVTDGGAPISREVSEGVALILGRSLDQRKHLRKLISQLYDRRSKVSHEGLRDIPDSEVREVRNIAANVLARMCRLGTAFSKRSELRDWLAEIRLSAEFDDPKP